MWGPRYTSSSTSRKNKKRRKTSPHPPPPDACGEDHASASPIIPTTSPPMHTQNGHQHQLLNSPSVAPQIQQVCNHAGHSRDPLQGDDNSSNCGKLFVMPGKHMLELIIDILQQRDTCEIFAEPVDSNEVEDYYQIIKEPMDFGTMRAKLHEGMYQNLEQFKHDVFLITRNAMHFNSSATIYFKQARAIHELAKRVFHVLGTDPRNFEAEFSGTRRRSARRARNKAVNFRLTTRVKPNSVTGNISSQGIPGSIGTSIFGKSSRGNSLLASRACRNNIKNYGLFSGVRTGQRSNYTEGDHRLTYRPQSFSFDCNNNLVGSKCFHSNPLVLTNNQGANYRESLLLFVKDLGPTAHMIATKKIRGLHEIFPIYQRAGLTCWGIESPESQIPDARGTSHHLDVFNITVPPKITGSLSSYCSELRTTSEMTEYSNYSGGGKEARGKKTVSSGGASGASPGEEKESCHCIERTNVVSATRRDKAIQNCKSTEFWLGSCSCDASSSGLNSRVIGNKNSTTKSTTLLTADAIGGKLDDNVRPVVLALEHSHANVSYELKSKNRKSCPASSATGWVPQSKASSTSSSSARWISQNKASSTTSTSHVNVNAATNSTSSFNLCHGATSSLVTSIQLQASESKKKYLQGSSPIVSSPFTFNMGFLKAQLNHMNLAAVGGRNDTLEKEP